jgi:predicted nucleic acid-binding protein
VFAPATPAFVRSGRLLAAAGERQGWDAIYENPSLLNDAYLASSCRECGNKLITNDGDFDRFPPFLGGWRHIAPWPVLST